MPVQVARRRANSRCRSRLGRREKRRRTVNFNDELGGGLHEQLAVPYCSLFEECTFSNTDFATRVPSASRRCHSISKIGSRHCQKLESTILVLKRSYDIGYAPQHLVWNTNLIVPYVCAFDYDPLSLKRALITISA